MAYVQKTRKELIESIGAQSNALGRQSQTGMEIINNQKQLEANKAQQNLEINSYVNQFRSQMGLTNRATVKAQAQGGTGGSALYNQQQATNALGQDLAQTQNNYQKFTRDVADQEKQYDEALTSLGNQAKGDVTEQNLATEMESNQVEANKAAKTASAIATGVNVATTAISTALMFTGIGAPAAAAVKFGGAALSGAAGGTAAALSAKAGGADTGGQVQAGFLAAGVNSATALFAMGGAGNAAGKTAAAGAKAASAEIGEVAGKEALKVGTSASVLAKQETNQLIGIGTKKTTQNVVEKQVQQTTADIVGNPQIKKTTDILSRELEKLGVADSSAYKNTINTQILEKQTQLQKQLTSKAIDEGKIPGTPQFEQFVTSGIKNNAKKLEAETMQMFKADYEKLSKETLNSVKDKVKGLAGKGKVKFSRVDRLRAGEIGNTRFALNTATRGGAAAGASYLGTQMVTTGATKKSTNQRTKETYGSIFDEIGRPDLRQKYGF